MARLSIASRTATGEAHEIRVEGGRVSGPAPTGFRARGQHGTRVEVRELFFATPARLKFLKSARSEDLATLDVVKRLAMARPDVAFTLTMDGRRALDLPREVDLFSGRLNRLSKIMGRDFADNATPVSIEREGVTIAGYAGLPTYNRANAQMQFLFVNGRPVRDKLLVGAVRGAYADFLARDRHPALALFLDCDPAFVDVNVHPAKTEVRFRDAGLVRGLIVSSLKHALAEAGHRASTTVAGAALAALPARLNARHSTSMAPSTAASRRTIPAARSCAALSGARRPPRASRSRRRKPPRICRSASRARSCTRPMSWPRRRTASSSSISTPRMSAWSMSA